MQDDFDALRARIEREIQPSDFRREWPKALDSSMQIAMSLYRLMQASVEACASGAREIQEASDRTATEMARQQDEFKRLIEQSKSDLVTAGAVSREQVARAGDEVVQATATLARMLRVIQAARATYLIEKNEAEAAKQAADEAWRRVRSASWWRRLFWSE